MCRKKHGFTLIELLVVIAVIAILAAILLPAFIAVKERSRMANCMSNFRQLWNGMQMYNNDWNSLPPFLACLYKKYVPGIGVYICKSDPYKGRPSFSAPDWETWQGFSALGYGSNKGCSYSYMPRVEFFHIAGHAPLPCWSGPVAGSNGSWVDSSKWVPNYDSWTPVLFDWWHAQNRDEPYATFQGSYQQKADVLILILGGSVKRCRHERQLPCQSQIGNAQHPRDVLR